MTTDTERRETWVYDKISTEVAYSKSGGSIVGLVFGGVLRIALGGSLYMAAPETNWPEVLQPLGIVLVIIGAIVPLLSVDILKSLSARLLEDDESTRWVALATCGILLFIVSLVLDAPV